MDYKHYNGNLTIFENPSSNAFQLLRLLYLQH